MGRLAIRISKVVSIIVRRLHSQGLRTTLLWFYVRGTDWVTGSPNLRYSQITEHLYVGPQYRKFGKSRLEAAGIRHSVNMRTEFNDLERDLALENHCYLPTIDDQAPTLEHVTSGVSFIERALGNGGKVYIHCGGGVGRAPTMAAAYLISIGYSYQESLLLIQRVRPFIQVTPVQLDLLRHFDGLYPKRNDYNLPTSH